MSKSGDMNYFKLEDLGEEYQTFYITDYSDNLILNWTKPDVARPLTGLRTDTTKYVAFNNTRIAFNDTSLSNYTLMYLDKGPDFNTSTAYCENNGGDLFTCMAVSVWGGASYLPESMVGYSTDRGRFFSGGVTDGGDKDTGRLSTTPVDYEFVDPSGAGWGVGGQTGRGCFAFTIYYWDDEPFVPSDNITSFYYRYWQNDKSYSEHYGIDQDVTFDYACIKKYDEEGPDWDYYEGESDYISFGSDSCAEGTLMGSRTTVQTVSNDTFNSAYTQSLVMGFKDGFEIDTSGENMYTIVPYFDGMWVNQLFNKYQHGFVAFNLPDDATLELMDSDGDGLNDYDELFVYYTDPRQNDTDNGGVDDYTEIMISSTDPNIYSDEEDTSPYITNITYSPDNDTTYLPETKYYFRANVTDDSSIKVNITFDGINYTAYQISDDIWEWNVTGLSEGEHNFSWYAVDLFNFDAQTELYYYTVAVANKFDLNITLSPGVNAFEFRPENGSHKAVEPTNQTSIKGAVTAHNNQSFEGLLMISLEEVYNTSYGNIVLKVNDEYNYSSAKIVTKVYGPVSADLNTLDIDESGYVWFWADYYYPTREWEPELYILIQEV